MNSTSLNCLDVSSCASRFCFEDLIFFACTSEDTFPNRHLDFFFVKIVSVDKLVDARFIELELFTRSVDVEVSFELDCPDELEFCFEVPLEDNIVMDELVEEVAERRETEFGTLME